MQLIADLRLTALSISERRSLGKKLKLLAGGSCRDLMKPAGTLHLARLCSVQQDD